MKKWGWNVLVALDQLGNALTLGDPDETISSRAGKQVKAGKWWAVALCKLLHLFDRGHCEKSIEGDEGKNEVLTDPIKNEVEP
jgi:hypothetical protein